MNLKTLLALLFAFLRPQVEGEPEADPQDPEPEVDPQPELDLDPADPDPEPRLASNEDLEAERRARTAEKDRADRLEREMADLRARQHQPAADPELAREEARLADANTPDLEKWQIRANRELRAGRSAAQTALMQAEDVRDQTSFSQLSVTEPALHKRYATRVEEELGKARQQGYFGVKREYIYNQLIAKDMRDGKFKKKAAPAATEDKSKGVQRGKTPGARSDVGGRPGAMSDREKRAKRLENVQI